LLPFPKIIISFLNIGYSTLKWFSLRFSGEIRFARHFQVGLILSHIISFTKNNTTPSIPNKQQQT
jgi:hypothetical protein